MMVKRILIVVILAVLVSATATFYVLKHKPVASKITENTVISPTPTVVALSTWTDEAGFTFQYPSGTQINNHPEDNTNYANLTLTYPSSEIANIVMADNSFKDLSAWAGQNSAIDTLLGGKPAKKIITNGTTTIACIDSGVLVTITGKDVSTIVDSWTFIYPTPTVGSTKTVKPAAPASNNSGDVLEEE